MAVDNFEQCLALTLVWEGGYVNDPADPGGATMKGVTQKVYDAYRAGKHLSTRSVAQIEDLELRDIYRTRYWDLVGGDKLPMGVDMALFDFAVNSGVRRAVKEAQSLVGVPQDGVMGNGTLMGILEYSQTKSPLYLLEAICDDRLAFLKGLPTFARFGKGWTRRVMGDHLGIQDGDSGVIDVAGAMALGDPVWGPTTKLYTPKSYQR